MSLGRCRRGWLGGKGKGKAAGLGDASPGAATSCQGSLAAGSPGLPPPKKKHTLLTEVRTSACSAVALRSTPAPVDGEGRKSPGGFYIPLFPLTLI